ncbi:hypothetical protein SK128_026013 [Halocaridina rubra]|uniref:Uncharacterized protein n=1 Tax=Halocaridina rubra TaxID=373956 RepID=A0AAN9A641_HALRR
MMSKHRSQFICKLLKEPCRDTIEFECLVLLQYVKTPIDLVYGNNGSEHSVKEDGKKTSLTVEEILEKLYEEDEDQVESADLVFIPPDVDEITDADEKPDDNFGGATVIDVSGTLELHIESKISQKQDEILPRESCQDGNAKFC